MRCPWWRAEARHRCIFVRHRIVTGRCRITLYTTLQICEALPGYQSRGEIQSQLRGRRCRHR